MTDEPESPEFERLLQYLRETRGFDFSGYKRTTLLRRIEKRMAQVGVKGHGPYLEYLQARPQEFTALFNTILINVTSFFRDPDAWDHLSSTVLPALLARNKQPSRAEIVGVYYNKTKLKALGSSVPKTFADFEKILAKSAVPSRRCPASNSALRPGSGGLTAIPPCAGCAAPAFRRTARRHRLPR